MFAGISSIKSSTSVEETDALALFESMISKDGEMVKFDEPIKVESNMPVKVWLKKLEDQMHTTLAKNLHEAVHEISSSNISSSTQDGKGNFISWSKKFPAQVMILATLINWSMGIDSALNTVGNSKHELMEILTKIEVKLEVMAESVLLDLPSEVRKKFEQLITELVHQRDVTKSLIDEGVSKPDDFRWLYHLRYKYNPMAEKLTEKLSISLSNANFSYGFEYLGIGERLVQTPLTDRCYLTLTQALHFGMGGNPFGPAGTGKTESVKALGSQLGRLVIVMNCDETFDDSAMERIFCGLCQVGAWGCFDEFNRLEERILSAVSQQILTIQKGLNERQQNIILNKRSIRLHENVGIFVTMNPGYAGRKNLPDNLKTLFRSVAMVVPDRKLIAQVMLYSQGIVSAQQLAGKIVDLFQACEKKMSKRSHYDFGLRALKTLLVSAGDLKRNLLEGNDALDSESLEDAEMKVLVQGVCNNVVPKLVAEDMNIFTEVLTNTFPGAEVCKMEDDTLREEIVKNCEINNFVAGENWIQKVLQVKQVLDMRHGVMLVGPSGVGKSSALTILSKSLEKIDNTKTDLYIIDPKAISKKELYGVLDGTTMEWTDGVFTSLLRTILANNKGESARRHWIIFDGDVDPEWAENLNSVLDDNKLLTLPNGERLDIPTNVRIILEVDSLDHATPATVSRCGMIWFSKDIVSLKMCLDHLFTSLRSQSLFEDDSSNISNSQIAFLDALKPSILLDNTNSKSLVSESIEFCLKQTHIMAPTRERLINSLRALLVKGIGLAIKYDEDHPDFPMENEHMDKFAKRWLIYSMLWSFTGSCSWDIRKQFSERLLASNDIDLPSGGLYIFEFRVRVEDGEYELWSESVPRMEIESHKVTATDVIITTNDTVRHSDILGACLSSRMPLILCGPPGSGKTMTLSSVLNVLEASKEVVVANLNFSSGTTPEILMKTFQQYCTYTRRGKDVVLEPSDSLGSHVWLVVFCDEINLPQNDSYGTQRVIMFMRQLVEQGGFWREDNVWVKINRIQFVGACNPPTDAGRVTMSSRFLRHAPLILVDFPASDSLMQIYGTFNAGMMKLFPKHKGYTQPMTEAMIELYSANRSKFTTDKQPQYFYSPRELSRWVRGIYEAISEMDQGIEREELVRIFAHEAQRLFCDRLVNFDEKSWCEEKIDEVCHTYFAGVNHDDALARPLLYSNFLTKETQKVGREDLKSFLSARLKVFREEELDVPLVFFDEVLDHVLRIDRILRQPMGHCLLVGESGSGKTVLSKFVSWLNGLSIFQIKAHSKYGLDDFNEDLRSVMRRVGIEGEKICFIFDEANALDSGFLEAMNALLASGEVPGLFEGEEYKSLINSCRDSAAAELIDESEESLWRRFTTIVQRNLHVVFTMNPSGGEWKTRSTTSPALFNRCVVDWFGTWSNRSMAEVCQELTSSLDTSAAESVGGIWADDGHHEILKNMVPETFDQVSVVGFRQTLVAALVKMHIITRETCAQVSSASNSLYLSPRDYLALLHNFESNVKRLQIKIEDNQTHVNAGLTKLNETQIKVSELQDESEMKSRTLDQKNREQEKKFQQIIDDQRKAETRKKDVEKMSKEVEDRLKVIHKSKDEAQSNLAKAEPALREAKEKVQNLNPRDINEIRNLRIPPENVELTMKIVFLVLDSKSDWILDKATKGDWSKILKMMKSVDLKKEILDFNVENFPEKKFKVFFDRNQLNASDVKKSSKACVALFDWVISQRDYFVVHRLVQPLMDEVARLEAEALESKGRLDTLKNEVSDLEKSLVTYKNEYRELTSEAETLKKDKQLVDSQVTRAESLIKSLGQEKKRWSVSKEGFKVKMRSIFGDSLLMAGFLTYFGPFDFKGRALLMEKWKETLDELGIEFTDDIDMKYSLSTLSDHIEWQAQGLPADTLSLENGVILEHCYQSFEEGKQFSRYPLIIDPSGEGIEFVKARYKDVKETSFVDDNFMKKLAGAVRFGTTLLVENVEKIDPVLNPILNKEIQRTGGRNLIRIGKEEVDYSPKFKIILTTRNSAAQLTPDLCSRVTLVNFSITPDSLQNQCVSIILKHEIPEVEERRKEVLLLQSKGLVELKSLEKQILEKISDPDRQGSILDDDELVKDMEELMKKGVQVEEDIAKNAEDMKQVQSASSKFDSVSMLCREMYVLLESLRQVNLFYEFSEKFFLNILKCVLERDQTSADDQGERVASLRKCLFSEIAARVGRSLSNEDKMVFALLLSRILDSKKEIPGDYLSVESITHFITDSFGQDFQWNGRGLSDLQEITDNDIDSVTPLMLCSAPGNDVSSRVESLAKQKKIDVSSVSLGSSDSFNNAHNLIKSKFKVGSWVLLKNCHLCTDEQQNDLVKWVQSLIPGSTFRLFLTSKLHSKLPTSLFRLSDIIVVDASTGVKATLHRFFCSINNARLNDPTRNKLYLILGWLHAVIQERLQFVPSGWSQSYEFTEADAIHALDAIDSLITEATKGKKNIDPDKLPWDAICVTLCKGIFGGKITNDEDQNYLNEMVNSYFTPNCFDINFKFVDGVDPLPDRCTKDDCTSWIQSLDDYTPPAWIGLDESAESFRSKSIAQSVTKKVRMLSEEH
eukprot:CAMPEP_0184869058 /NCGR_PEP_ID=MMETSP0580-20130426/32666_1 /TAXON_ID=1118495 /ORGANISM="Dactyliosolen fragilissimus" /LENGTH=2586 /DNA_ID=CAMNT_0027370293 /DNA_START=1 /DNA_END=7761 /DNA_ORIENTATION=+